MVKTGTGFSIGFAEETPYGTAASSISHNLDPRGGMESLQGEVDHIVPESLSFRGNDSAQFVAGMRRASGSVTHDLRFGGGWMMFLSHLTGHKYATTGVSSPYSHAIPLGMDLSTSDSQPQSRGVTFLVDREGDNAASSSKAWLYSGMKPTACDFTFEQGSIANASWEFTGSDVATIARPASVALATVPYIAHPSAGGGTLVKSVRFGVDGSEVGYDVRSMSLHLEQPVAERRTIEGATPLVPVPGGNFIASGSFEIEAPDNAVAGTFDVFTDLYRSAGTNSLLMTVEGAVISGSTNHSLSFDFPKVRVTNVGEPQVADSGLILRTVEWEAAYSGVAATGVGSCTLVTSDTAGYTAA
tara:strand:- start:527 stop:1597 length:1071 start_codon:yes stop_codon:yes gene_type:complete